MFFKYLSIFISSVILSLSLNNGLLEFVSFEESKILFFDYIFEKDDGEIYNYCPSAFYKDENIHLYYCENQTSGVIKDSIVYRNILNINNAYYAFEDKEVLSSSESGWDNVHVCDPSVIKGAFSFNEQPYSYLMAYLGCDNHNCQNNSIGLAVSNAPEGPWTKVSEISPFLKFERNMEHNDCFQWGYGQPSLINLNEQGLVFISYTQGLWNVTQQKVEIWDLSNLNNPIFINGGVISNQGLLFTDGSGCSDFISNADFALDKVNNTLYMVADSHPFGTGELSNIASTSRVSYIENVDSAHIFDILKSANWTDLYLIDEMRTGSDKNHNCGFLRDEYGHILGTPDVLYTSAVDNNSFLEGLWSYTIQLIK